MKLESVLILTALAAQIACAQTLTPKRVALYKTDTLQAPQSSRDHFPFLQLDMSESTNTFLLAFCEYDIAWASATNEQETIKKTFMDLSVITADGKSIAPIGKCTADRRLSLISNPKYARVEAQERWGATTLRVGALFLVDRNEKEFTVAFADTKHKATASTDPLPKPADLAKISIIECELVESLPVNPPSQTSRALPGVKSTLSTDAGKLLLVKVNLAAQAPNVLGGECRYIYRPSDFMLQTNSQLLPLGFLSRTFGLDTIYNVSRKSVEELQEVDNELTLVFAVPADYQTGTLTFLGTPQGEVAIP